MDLPQIYMEPILLRQATTNGIVCRFQTELVDLKRDELGFLSTVKDDFTQLTYQIRSRYVFGADGGSSQVARSEGFEFDNAPSGGIGANFVFSADLTKVMQDREGLIHFITNPGAKRDFGLVPALRMVRPWKRWLLMSISPGLHGNPWRDVTPDSPELHAYIKEAIGDPSIDVTVHAVQPWVIHETVAKAFSKSSNVFLLGDAAHKHPPAFGLGSNTCIQEAYNLAWKVAYVEKGWAGRPLLDTYSIERQPVGAQLVRLSNEDMDRHGAIWGALGMLAPPGEEGVSKVQELSAVTESGSERRAALHTAMERKRWEGESLGLAMNQLYNSSAIYLEDEGPRPAFEGDVITDPIISTYPGTRLPHAWLTKVSDTQPEPISTKDLAGHGCFTLFTGPGGEPWRKAASAISNATGIPIRTYAIGRGLDYHDKWRDWVKQREVEEDGCVLVRPDCYVAWRSQTMVATCQEKLLHVLNHVLSRE